MPSPLNSSLPYTFSHFTATARRRFDAMREPSANHSCNLGTFKPRTFIKNSFVCDSYSISGSMFHETLRPPFLPLSSRA